jgi:hypothetical protein
MTPKSIDRQPVKQERTPLERVNTAPAARRTGKRWIAGVLGVALGLAFLARKSERSHAAAPAPEVEAPVLLSQAVLASAPSTSAAPPEAALASHASPSPRGPKKPNASPRILSAALDRSSLCPGESTWLRVSAEDPDDSDLRYQARYFSPELGRPVFGFGRWIRYQAPRRPGRYEVVPFVTDPSGARDSMTLGVTVEPCERAPGLSASELVIGHRELDAQTHQFDLGTARRRAESAGKSFEVRGWRFGDEPSGAEKNRAEKNSVGMSLAGKLEVRHRYPVVLGQRYSYYLVQAEVSIDGERRRLEYGLTFYSYVAANLKGGYVALAADVERGRDQSQQIEYTVTFSNPTPFAAYAREYEQVCLDEAGVPRLRRREPLDLTIPGDDALEQTFELDRAECPGGATYELFGETTGGYRTGGLWSYKFRPRAQPEDPAAARARAREVLSQEELHHEVVSREVSATAESVR